MYVITGVDARLKQFKPIRVKRLDHALMYNIYRGTLWKEASDGSRTRVHRWWN
jgi:hypothetical protein